METFRTRLKQARQDAGLSTAKAAQELAAAAPRSLWATDRKIERIEDGSTVQVNPLLVQALCDIYGADFDTVAPELIAEREALSNMLFLPTERPGSRPRTHTRAQRNAGKAARKRAYRNPQSDQHIRVDAA